MSDLADLSAFDLLTAYRSQALSPVAVTEAVLARIAAAEPHLDALYAFDPDGARAAARDSERRWRDGTARDLDGVPATIKENIATKGVPVPLGTAARDLVPADPVCRGQGMAASRSQPITHASGPSAQPGSTPEPIAGDANSSQASRIRNRKWRTQPFRPAHTWGGQPTIHTRMGASVVADVGADVGAVGEGEGARAVGCSIPLMWALLRPACHRASEPDVSNGLQESGYPHGSVSWPFQIGLSEGAPLGPAGGCIKSANEFAPSSR